MSAYDFLVTSMTQRDKYCNYFMEIPAEPGDMVDMILKIHYNVSKCMSKMREVLH